MPKLIPPLSELQVKKAKPADQPYRLADGKGLYLQIMPNGSRYWRMKYRIDGKEKTASFGVYPEVSLAEARDACIAARKQISAGIDPSVQKQQVKREKAIEAASSFEIVAREWFENQKDGWSEVYAGKVINSLEVDVFPRIGSKPIRDIDAPQMLEILRTVESRGVRETAKRILQRSRAVFQYGIMTGRCTRNPAADIDAETVLKKGPGVQHMARVKTLDIPQLMRDIAAYEGEIVTRLALQFMALTFARTKEMINAEWSEFDEKAAEWRVPAERMKMRDPHIVPLSSQALEVLAELRKLNGHERYVFYSVQGRKPISNNTMLFALYRMGYKSRMTGHGFRGLAATVLRELGYSRDVVDRQLAHAERNQVTAAYAHAEQACIERLPLHSDHLLTQRHRVGVRLFTISTVCRAVLSALAKRVVALLQIRHLQLALELLLQLRGLCLSLRVENRRELLQSRHQVSTTQSLVLQYLHGTLE